MKEKTVVATTLWNDDTGTTGFNCIQLGLNGDAEVDTDGGVKTAAATAVICADDGGAGDSIIVTTAAAAGQGDETRIKVVFTIDAGDDGLTITEVALRNGGGIDLSRVLLGTAIGVSTGTILTVNYDMTVT